MAINSTNTTQLRHIATFISSGNFVAPKGVTKIWVTVYGAGGGHNVNGQGIGGGGGAGKIGGAWVNVVPGGVYPVVVGAAGSSTGMFTGTNGGITYFDGAVIANGGNAGGYGYAGTTGTIEVQNSLNDTYPSGAQARTSAATESTNVFNPGDVGTNSFYSQNSYSVASAGRVEIFSV